MKKEKKKIRYMPSGVLKKFVFVFAALYLGIMGAATYLVQESLRRIIKRRFRV